MSFKFLVKIFLANCNYLSATFGAIYSATSNANYSAT